MIDRRKQCGACNNMEAYWEAKARAQAAEKKGLREQLERLAEPADEEQAFGEDQPIGEEQVPDDESQEADGTAGSPRS